MPDLEIVEYHPADGPLVADYTYRGKTRRIMVKNPWQMASLWQIECQDEMPESVMVAFVRDAMSEVMSFCNRMIAEMKRKAKGNAEKTA